MCNTNIYVYSTKKLRRKLRRIPGYAQKIALECNTSTMTVYRVLKGESSPKSYFILETANNVVREHQSQTKKLNHERERN
jgi:hypothetical protein